MGRYCYQSSYSYILEKYWSAHLNFGLFKLVFLCLAVAASIIAAWPAMQLKAAPPRQANHPPAHQTAALPSPQPGGVAGVTSASATPTPKPPPALPGPASTPSNPFAGFRLYVDPASDAAHQAASWHTTQPADAILIQKLAAGARSYWLGDWTLDVQAEADRIVTRVTAAGALPVLVAYAIPRRDCGGYSAGGHRTPHAYRAWISALAKGIGHRKAVVILEPDALAGASCLSATDYTTRFALLAEAVRTLKTTGPIAVYLDAGHPHWLSVAEISHRLTTAGLAQADGFSLNVSNYITTVDNLAYGRQISALTGGKHFVIDTSRNGRGPVPGHDWCNPPGRGLGQYPTTQTGDPLADAFLWIKIPGESDGTCNGGPAAGQWWPASALDLARNAP